MMFKFASHMAIFTDFEMWWLSTKAKNNTGVYALQDFTGDSFEQSNVFASSSYVKSNFDISSISFSVAIDGGGNAIMMQRRKNNFIRSIFDSKVVHIGIFTPRGGWLVKRLYPTAWEGVQHAPYAKDDYMIIDIEADINKGTWHTLPLRRNFSEKISTQTQTHVANFVMPESSSTVYPQILIRQRSNIGPIHIFDPNGVSVRVPDTGSATFVSIDLDPNNRSLSFDGVIQPWRDNNFIEADFAIPPGVTTNLNLQIAPADNGQASYDAEVRVYPTSRMAF